MNSVGINTDSFNEKMLQIANALKPLGVYVECEKAVDAKINLYPRGTFITKLDVSLCFYSEDSEKQEAD
ncbi:MAG: hypothetical protein IKP60_13915 [Treponema sp.]|nr:hypothetical protein [Treponema sp.]